MGSSPVTAINSFVMDLLVPLQAFFRDFSDGAPLGRGDGVVVAFSGGPDSTALLLGMARLAERLGCRLAAAHLDHGMDSGSAERAREAARLAVRIGVPLIAERREVPALRRPSESPEAAARRVRYEMLEEVRRRLGARYTATAHHRDDQAETVLLRLLFGSGLEGLAGIRPVRGPLVRPLLSVPRESLRAAVAEAGLSPIEDPTNADLGAPRSRVRHRLLPELSEGDRDGLAPRLARLAERARGAGAALDRGLAGRLAVREVEGGAAADWRALRDLPPGLLPFALSLLHRRSGAPYPAGSPARGELLRQIAGPIAGKTPRVACDCGDGWCWTVEEDLLILRRLGAGRERVPHFTYTLEVPGELAIPEIGARVGLRRRPVEPWMFEGSPRRAGLALPLKPGDRVTVRNRRPGDRLHPLGSSGSRKLKEVLVDHRVPRHQRERLPLLCVGERIAWVPGVTIDHGFRITGEAAAWVATWESETR